MPEDRAGHRGLTPPPRQQVLEPSRSTYGELGSPGCRASNRPSLTSGRCCATARRGWRPLPGEVGSSADDRRRVVSLRPARLGASRPRRVDGLYRHCTEPRVHARRNSGCAPQRSSPLIGDPLMDSGILARRLEFSDPPVNRRLAVASKLAAGRARPKMGTPRRRRKARHGRVMVGKSRRCRVPAGAHRWRYTSRTVKAEISGCSCR